MKFLLDENVDIRLATYLREKTHDVHTVIQDYRHGLPDRDLLDIARRERRILVTNDLDFGELIFRRQLSHTGIILLRLRTVELSGIMMAMDHVLQNYAQQIHRFIVITDHGVRVRRTDFGLSSRSPSFRSL